MPSLEDKIEQAIPAEIHMISGSQDSQTSADVYNTNKFDLPNPAGKAGGACTSALLQTLYNQEDDAETLARKRSMTWVELLQTMRARLLEMGYDQIPQLTSSRMTDVHKKMHIVPSGSTGRRRAVLIGINYVGQKGELSGCQNDVWNIRQYLIEVQGFDASDMLILMDDGQHHLPTRQNIMEAFAKVADHSKDGDVVFVHYSGHGGRSKDRTGDEADGYDETLIPVDFREAGQILDDDLLVKLVKPIRKGVNVTVLMDCCHSGTVLDLPYKYGADENKMHVERGFDVNKMMVKMGKPPAESAGCGCVIS